MVARTLTSSQLDALSIPTADQMRTIAATIPQLELGSWREWDARPGVFLEVGPGLVRVFRTAAHLPDAARDRAWLAGRRTVDQQLARERALYRSPMALLSDGDLEALDRRKPRRIKTSTGRITGWSRRSRARMNMQLRRVDFTPLFEDGLEPAMVTLTMPGRDESGRDIWSEYAPTPGDFKKIVNRFTAAYRAAWGQPIRGVWKMEFQDRGAPHLHILMTPPAGLCGGRRPVEFRAWLARAWPQCVGSEGIARERHEAFTLRRQTIEYVGDGYRDPQRIAVYFGKHSTFREKEYQNEMPRIWRDAVANGEDGARFWGVWGLKKGSAVLQLDDAGSASVESMVDPLGVSMIAAHITRHYQRLDDGTWVLVEERRPSATDASVLRAAQRAADDAGSRSSDVAKVQRHMRKLSRSLAMRGQRLERNKHGQPILPRDSRAIRRIRFEAPDRDTGELRTIRRYRVGYYAGGSGFLLVSDGRRSARDIQRILDNRARWEVAA